MFCGITFSQYEFPTDYYPAGSHPRIWLTQERLTTLQAARTANTEEWQRFYAQVTILMDTSTEVPNGWPQWVKYSGAIPFTALMYQLTGDTIYANKTFYFAMKADTSFASSENYWIGNCEYLACGYDWIYNYMNADQKDAYRKVIMAYSNNMWHIVHWDGSNDTYTSMDSDRNTLGGSQYLMFGAAMYGDFNEDAIKLLNRFWWIWSRGTGDSTRINSMKPNPVRKMVGDAQGGIYYTGLAYYMGTDIRGISHIFSTLRTACNYNLVEKEPQLTSIWKNLIRGVIDQTDPPRAYFYNLGDWQDDNNIYDQPWTHRFLTYAIWEADQCGSSDWAAIGRGFKNSCASYRHADQFTEFFFTTPGASSVDPYTANLPLIRASKGIDYLFFRNGWGTNATYGAFSAQGAEPVDHQGEDTGCFTLFREDDYLTKTLTGYRDFNDASFVFNNLSIENGMTNGSPRVRTGGEKKASMDRHRENNSYPLFAYAMMQGDGQWNLGPGEWAADTIAFKPVKTYRRHFFWAGDYVVVLDRLRAKKQVSTTYRLRALSEPNLTDYTITQSSINGNQKLLHQTLEPLGVTFEKFDESVWKTQYQPYEMHTADCKWQYRIKPATTDSLNLLNVMQMGPSSMSSFDPMEHISDQNNSGVKIGNWAIVFGTGENLRNNVIYTINATADTTRHLIADIEPGNYYIYANNIEVAHLDVLAEDNTAYFTTCTSGSTEIKMTPVALPVELESFAGKQLNGKVILNWTTATEKSNYGFFIERKLSTSRDGDSSWIELGFVKGNGNSNSKKAYSFEDNKIKKAGKYVYRLRQADTDGIIHYAIQIEISVNFVKDFKLEQNFPNPFNPSTTIKYYIPLESKVSITVYNALGSKVKELVNETKHQGNYDIKFDGQGLASGVYFVTIKAASVDGRKSFVDSKKMILMK
ncbi:MAG: T9SS type A sorting domain-containing protein [Bacteroidota bacterium]|nr:T9SS type A sorting domain-containing protein [Bacteroidota bacterium]